MTNRCSLPVVVFSPLFQRLNETAVECDELRLENSFTNTLPHIKISVVRLSRSMVRDYIPHEELWFFFCSVKVMKAILMAVTSECTWKRFMNEWCSPAQREKKPLYMFTPPTFLVGIPWKEEKVPPWSEGTYFSSIHVQPMLSPKKKNRKEKKVKHRRGATEKKTVSNNIINLETIMIYCDGNWKHSFVGARQTVIFVF